MEVRKQLAGRGAVRHAARIAAGVNDEHVPAGQHVGLGGELIVYTQRRPAGADALTVGIGYDHEACMM